MSAGIPRGGAARLLLIAVGAVVAAGCTKGTRDLAQRVEEIKARKGQPIEPLPVMQHFETFEYQAQDLRDPFSPSVEEQVAGDGSGTQGPDPNRVKEALEAFPLDALDMVGTLGKGEDVTGLIKDADGVIHRVRPENYLGQNYGRITAIYEDRIELVELIPNGIGGWIERPAQIALGDE
jgi:type IV pilus assembly protein PilP